MNSIGEFATASGRRPDWWLQAGADAMRRTHHRILTDHEPLPELMWLAERIEYLLHLAEHSSSGGEAA